MHKVVIDMYKYSNGQISLADFRQPVGMHLKENNRWVKKAQTIPWSEIEQRYAALFVNRKGNVAKPLRLALGAYIIQAEYGFSDEETAQMIQEHPCFQYFCGYPGYDDEHSPFDPSLMVYFRKRLTPEVLGEINEMILNTVRKEPPHEDDDDHGTGGNSGTMIADATCAPSNIRYPQDASLLNEARENTEDLLDELHKPADGRKPRIYRAQAHRDFLQFSRSRKKRQRKSARRLASSCAIWHETLPPLTKSLLCTEPFPNEKTTVSRPSARSMRSRSTCMTTAVTRSRTGLSASAGRFSAPLCGARLENP